MCEILLLVTNMTIHIYVHGNHTDLSRNYSEPNKFREEAIPCGEKIHA